MMRILKCELSLKDTQIIRVPEMSEILDVQLQGDTIVMWLQCNQEKDYTEIKIDIYGTGNDMPEYYYGEYLGTVQLRGFVWHVYMD